MQPAKITLWKDNNGSCASKDNHKLLHLEVEKLLNSSIIPQLRGLHKHLPASSCADIYHGHPSGYYWLSGGSGPLQVYCSLNENCCCSDSDGGKWMRIAFLNMSDPSAQCPVGWREVQSPIRTCLRKFNTFISSVSYSSHGIPYSRVCGRIIAYQYGTTDAFLGYNYHNQTTLNDAYIDGISVTYGHNPRHHIWTFVAARSTFYTLNCPCTANTTISTPPFLHDDYFCERETNNTNAIYFYDNNPLWAFLDNNTLWDGHGCTGSSTCCEFNNPPWFCRQLPQPTTEDIEIRIMGSVSASDSDTVLRRLEEEDTSIEFIAILTQ